jgi:cysteine desulfurase
VELAYLDNNATTPLLPEVREAVLPFLAGRFGNPSSLHARGRAAHAALEAAREQVARLVGARPHEIVFTSGGSEGDTAALLGLVSPGDHVVTSTVEHHAVLATCRHLEKLGVAVTYLPVDGVGRVDPDDVRAALRPRTRLVSIILASNETGVLQPVEEIGRIAAEADVFFHTDAVQAVGKIPVDVAPLRCDLLTLSGHKLHAPPGIGALYVRSGTFPRPLVHGGTQEHGLRAGTENLPGIVGLGVAAELAAAWLAGSGPAAMAAERDRLERAALERIERVRVNAAGAPRVPNTTSLVIPAVAGKSLVVALDLEGIAISTGSACAAVSNEPPHVLLAMGLAPEEAYATVRFSLGKQTRPEELDQVLRCLPGAVARLRALSPLWTGHAASARQAR